METIKTLTLGELIKVLQEAEKEHGPDVPVVSSSSYEECDETQQANGFVGLTTMTFLKPTPQYSSGFRVSEPEEEDANVQDSDLFPKALLIL